MRTIHRFFMVVFLLVGGLPAHAQEDLSDVLPITDDVIYTVRPGDTLDEIGALFDVSPRCIAAMNDMTIYDWAEAGTELLISVSCPRYAEDPVYLPTSTVLIAREVVKRPECAGIITAAADTIEGLAKILQIMPDALREANNLSEDDALVQGMCLRGHAWP